MKLRPCPDCNGALVAIQLESGAWRKRCKRCGKLWCDIDGFAGAGGASVAMERAGVPPDEAFNHSPQAVAIHAANHPRCRHHIEDVYAVDISTVVGDAHVNSGWFSPDCTHHSNAKGGKPLDNSRRGLCWVIIEWIDALGDRAPRKIYLENVQEFEQYGPLGPDNKPDKSLRGTLFHLFVAALRARGYDVEWGTMIASEFGAGTSRKRLFLVARRDGRRIAAPAVIRRTHGDGLKPLVTAAECIDWSIPCPSIFERAKPLADKTLARIAKGIDRFVLNCADPFIIPVTHSGDLRTHSVREPFRTFTCAHRGEHALIVPTLIQTGYGERPGQSPRVPGLHKPLGTAVASGAKHALVCAFLAQHNNHRGRDPNAGRSLSKTMSTLTATPQQGIVTAHLLSLKGTGRHRDMREPMFTQCGGGNHIAAVHAFLMKYHGHGTDLQSVKRPLLTIDTEDRFALVVVHGVLYEIVDIGMRMLQWHELAKATGFPPDYRFDVPFRGKPMTKTEIVRGIGNSVPPDPAFALIAANEDMPDDEMREAA
jgi:DNA (cytosine-5)-methyltransferase 1